MAIDTKMMSDLLAEIEWATGAKATHEAFIRWAQMTHGVAHALLDAHDERAALWDERHALWAEASRLRVEVLRLQEEKLEIAEIAFDFLHDRWDMDATPLNKIKAALTGATK